MQIKEALNALNDGHTIWKVGFARRVCKAFDLPFNEDELVQQFYTRDGYLMGEGNEGALGVDSCYLSQYVADQLGVAKQAKDLAIIP